jgi:hypothetical protein
MIFSRNSLYIFIVTLFQLPIYSVFAYTTDRSLVSYFTDNVLLTWLIYGGYYTLAVISVIVLLAIFFQSFRTYIISSIMALIAIYLLILIYEVFEDLSLLPN